MCCLESNSEVIASLANGGYMTLNHLRDSEHTNQESNKATKAWKAVELQSCWKHCVIIIPKLLNHTSLTYRQTLSLDLSDHICPLTGPGVYVGFDF